MSEPGRDAFAASWGEDDGWRVRKDGFRFRANATKTAIRGDDGSLQGHAKVTRDVTERREHEKLRNRERLLGRQKRYTEAHRRRPRRRQLSRLGAGRRRDVLVYAPGGIRDR